MARAIENSQYFLTNGENKGRGFDVSKQTNKREREKRANQQASERASKWTNNNVISHLYVCKIKHYKNSTVWIFFFFLSSLLLILTLYLSLSLSLPPVSSHTLFYLVQFSICPTLFCRICFFSFYIAVCFSFS